MSLIRDFQIGKTKVKPAAVRIQNGIKLAMMIVPTRLFYLENGGNTKWVSHIRTATWFDDFNTWQVRAYLLKFEMPWSGIKVRIENYRSLRILATIKGMFYQQQNLTTDEPVFTNDKALAMPFHDDFAATVMAYYCNMRLFDS